MAAKKLIVYPAFSQRLRHYRDRIGKIEGRPQVATQLVEATNSLVHRLLQNPARGHLARFESDGLRDILRASVPGFPIFAIFYRWDGRTLTIITVEHTAQDLPSRLASVVSVN
jgi:plasmid stabilization system protein ParE